MIYAKVLNKSELNITTVWAENVGGLEAEVEKTLKNRPGGRHQGYEAWVAGGKKFREQETGQIFSIA